MRESNKKTQATKEERKGERSSEEEQRKKKVTEEERRDVEAVRDVMMESLIDLIGSRQPTTVGMNQTHPQAG